MDCDVMSVVSLPVLLLVYTAVTFSHCHSLHAWGHVLIVTKSIHELHVQWFNDSVMSLADHARGGPGGSSGGRFGQCFGQDSGLVDCQGLTLHNEAHLLEV